MEQFQSKEYKTIGNTQIACSKMKYMYDDDINIKASTVTGSACHRTSYNQIANAQSKWGRQYEVDNIWD